jgi:hypothetical protein
MKDMLLGAFIGVVVTVSIEYYNYKEPQVYVPEPVLSKCDSIIFANDSLMERNHILENRLLTFKLGLAQLKMVDKPAHDYLINAGNFKFIEEWDQF